MSKKKDKKTGQRFLPKGMVLLHEDRDILVVDKPAGLLTMGTEKERSRTAYSALTEYVRKGSDRSKLRIFIVHRIDKETSGVLVFAKTEEAKFHLQNQWPDTKKKYLAVVHGHCRPSSGTISSYLAENSVYKVYSTPVPEEGRLSHTAYKVLKETKDFTLLELDLLTGRKHQIRVHLADEGNPVVGDRKYGKESPLQRYRKLALHAKSLTLRHPFNEKEMFFEAKTPNYFQELIGPL